MISNILVVGSGSIAKRHIANLRLLHPGTDIICVGSRGENFSPDIVGATTVMTAINDAIKVGLDYAIVASPAHLHIKHAQILLNENIPTLIEKPLCVELTDIKELNFDETRHKVAVGYNLRLMPSAQKVKQVLMSGGLGKIISAHADVGQHLPDWRPGLNYKNSVSAQAKLGGGALLELSHELDYLIWFFGNFVQVSGFLGCSKLLDIDVEDSVDAILINSSGVLCHLHMDFLQRSPQRGLKIIAENGTLNWNLLDNFVEVSRPSENNEVLFSCESFDPNDMYLNQLVAFEKYIQGSGYQFASIHSAIEVMKLVEAIRKSSKQKMLINL